MGLPKVFILHFLNSAVTCYWRGIQFDKEHCAIKEALTPYCILYKYSSLVDNAKVRSN